MTSVKNERFELLSLPDVVIRHLCRLLDVRSLTNLRLTCKSLKYTVEQPSILENIPITITYSKQLQRVLETTVSYNNFVLSFHSLEDQSFLTVFGDVFGECIKKLKVTTCGGYKEVLMLLQKCTQLEELELINIDFQLLASLLEKKTSHEKILQNLKNLRKLVIHENRKQLNGEDVAINTFLQIVRSCELLEEVKIPCFAEYNRCLIKHHGPSQNANNEVPMDQNEGENWEWEIGAVESPMEQLLLNGNRRDPLLHPIIECIQSRNPNSPHRIKRINVSEIIIFEWNSLKDLLDLCYRKRIKLVDAHSSQFLYIKDEMSSVAEKYFEIFDSVKVVQLHEGFPMFRMTNLRRVSLEISPLGSYSNVPDENCRCLLPRLEALRMQFVFAVNQSDNQDLISKVFKEVQRPTVTRLHLEWHLQEPARTIQAIDLVNNYGNLKELKIYGWDALDRDFILLWTHLHQLEDLTIKDCKNLTNRAFMGDFNLNDKTNIPNRPLNRLKKLQSLTIRDLHGSVTDVAMLGCFQWIRLKYFFFDSSVIDAINIDVYRAMENSPFGESIEYFYGPKPIYNRKVGNKHAFKNLRDLFHKI